MTKLPPVEEAISHGEMLSRFAPVSRDHTSACLITLVKEIKRLRAEPAEGVLERYVADCLARHEAENVARGVYREPA